MRSLLKDIKTSILTPGFWAFSGWLDIVASYRRSRLGVLWIMAPTLLYVGGVGGFFASLNGMPLSFFAAHVALGVVIFRLVTSVVTESTTIFSSSQAFILDGHVRLTDFVLRVVAKALFYFAVAIPVVAVALAVHPQVSLGGLALFVLSFPLVLLNVIWIGVVMALMGARFPDVGQFTNSIFVFAFLLTPIIWFAGSAPTGTMRGDLMRLNPMFHMVELIRAPILGEPLEASSLRYLLIMTVAGWCLAGVMYRRYASYVPLWV